MNSYNINDNKIKFNPHKFEGKKSLEFYQNQIYSTLSKIGITKEFIDIEYSAEDKNGENKTEIQQESYAQVTWQINKKQFQFRCESQISATLNLGAISQAIQEDIRQVTRGIKDLFMIMTQYEIKTKGQVKKTNLLQFSSESDTDSENENRNFNVDDLSLIQIGENEVLAKEYEYLNKVSIDRLNILYLNFKNECIKQNKQNHPMLRALMIVRKKRGLD